MSEKKGSWLDWLLYFGSKDERHRRAADRAGHLAFWVAFVAAFVDFLVRFHPAVPGLTWENYGPVAGDLAVILVGGGVYCWQWVAKGVTFLDTVVQRLLTWILAALTALFTGAVSYVGWASALGWGLGSLAVAALVGLVGGALVLLVVFGGNRWARARAEAGEITPGDDE